MTASDPRVGEIQARSTGCERHTNCMKSDVAYLLAELADRDEKLARVEGVIARLDDEHKNALAGESNCAEANYGAGLMAYQAQTYAYKQAATLLRAAVAAANGGDRG